MMTTSFNKSARLCLVIAVLALSSYYMMYHGFGYAFQRERNRIMSPTTNVEHFYSKISNVSTTNQPSKMSTARNVIGRPRIAFWARQFHRIDWKFPQLSNGDGGCDISFDRKDVPNADAVVFFMKSCKPGDRPPASSRRTNQVYVWFSHESPWTTSNFYGHKLTEYNDYFNWTMTYRTDSDVIAAMWPTPAMDFLMYRVGRTEEMLDVSLATKPRLSVDGLRTQTKALLAKKTSLIAWIVSDCDLTKGATKRMRTVQTLEGTGIKLTKFGKCVGNPIPFVFTTLFQTLAPQKFYLAFENSVHCQDYLTEKTIFNSFVSGTVPVIHGPSKEDAKKILPKGSYIHVEDFPNMRKLAEYLHYLDRNDTAYVKYFEWWMDPGAQTFPRFGFNFGPSYVPRNKSLPEYTKDDLQDDWLEYERFGLYHLCRKLKRGDHLKKNRVIPSLADWWYGKQPPECRT